MLSGTDRKNRGYSGSQPGGIGLVWLTGGAAAASILTWQTLNESEKS
jgi:hypothetical protein